jgi:hypothetical protein
LSIAAFQLRSASDGMKQVKNTLRARQKIWGVARYFDVIYFVFVLRVVASVPWSEGTALYVPLGYSV